MARTRGAYRRWYSSSIGSTIVGTSGAAPDAVRASRSSLVVMGCLFRQEGGMAKPRARGWRGWATITAEAAPAAAGGQVVQGAPGDVGGLLGFAAALEDGAGDD